MPATSELLETLAVPVLGWRTPTLPLFYTGEGGPPVSAVVGSAEEAAQVASAHWAVDPGGGLMLGRPPVDGLDLASLIDQAVRQVRADGITGQAVTPAVLALVEELSDGRSVAVNRQLICDNAGLAAEIAVAWAGMTGG